MNEEIRRLSQEDRRAKGKKRNALQVLQKVRGHVAEFGITAHNPDVIDWITRKPQSACPRGMVTYFAGQDDWMDAMGWDGTPVLPVIAKAMGALDRAAGTPKNQDGVAHDLPGYLAEAKALDIQEMKGSNQKRAALAFIDRGIKELANA